MRIAFGCDHAAVDVRDRIVAFLRSAGHEVLDRGCTGPESCDYPDYAKAVACDVRDGKADRGVLVCGTGVGMSIAANKVRGIRAAVCWNDDVARLVSEHNNANVLCLGARFATPEEMTRWITLWLATPASTQPRHVARIAKMTAIEEETCASR